MAIGLRRRLGSRQPVLGAGMFLPVRFPLLGALLSPRGGVSVDSVTYCECGNTLNLLRERWTISPDGHFLCDECSMSDALDVEPGPAYVKAYCDTLLCPHHVESEFETAWVSIYRDYAGCSVRSTGLYGVDLVVEVAIPVAGSPKRRTNGWPFRTSFAAEVISSGSCQVAAQRPEDPA